MAVSTVKINRTFCVNDDLDVSNGSQKYIYQHFIRHLIHLSPFVSPSL